MKLLGKRISRLSAAIKVVDNSAFKEIISSSTTVEIPGINPACYIRSPRYHLFVDLPKTMYTATIRGKGYQSRTVDIAINDLDPKMPVVEVQMERL